MEPHQLLTGLAIIICTSCGNDDWENACTVEETEDGAEITCPNKTSAIITNGEDGKDGRDGVDGVDGKDGQDGLDGASGAGGGSSQGESCTIVNDGDEVSIECPDGTSVVVGSADGANGTNGSDGSDGQDGADGTSCTVVDTDEGATISCTDGTSVDIADGQDGEAGTDGRNGTNGVDGADGTNGTDGADGTGCTITDTAAGATVSCGGTSVAIADGTDGTDGQDGQDGLQLPPVFTSGNRLELIEYDGADGSQYVTYFWDRTLEVACTVSYHADGSLRCLPTYAQPQTTSSYFADDLCTTKVVIDQYPGTPKYAVESIGIAGDEKAIAGQYRIFSIGSQYTGTVYSGSPASCSASTATGDFYFVGSELPSSTFVQFTRQ